MVTMVLSYIISEIKWNIGRKSLFFVPLAFEDRRSCRNIAIRFGTGKLFEWLDPDSEKKFKNTFTRFDTIHERDIHPDRRTDGRTDTARRHKLCTKRIPLFGVCVGK